MVLGLQRGVVLEDYSGLQRAIQKYTEGYILIYIALHWDYNGLPLGDM